MTLPHKRPIISAPRIEDFAAKAAHHDAIRVYRYVAPQIGGSA